MEDVRIVLRNIIEERGYKQAAIANRANIPPKKLNAILNLRRELKATEMFAICDAIGINYSELKRTKTA